ncbi:MAG: bifunctional response regulator/alkaline phosphatase family protein [Bacteroidia bacterium]|nr:bifunctional response regulator/alkaline phosphatase family protein [Bacteroidia bacterium]
MDNKIKILWADDEIDLLKPHILFLQQKGYEMITVNNGNSAVELAIKEKPDLVFLDENMPGMSGFETLSLIKANNNNVKVVMITKSEEEFIMDEAIGSKISDYLIKPVNPNQILLSIKKLIDKSRLITERTNQGYQQDFRNITMSLMDKMDFDKWKEVYDKLIFWELELDKGQDKSMSEILVSQKKEANHNFSKFIAENFLSFLQVTGDAGPVMSHNLLRRKVIPFTDEALPVYFILIDNLRQDQWKMIAPVIAEKFRIDSEDMYLSILPTTTQYCRNSIFSGLLPSEIEKRFPDKWSNDEDEGGKNNFEDYFLQDLLKRLRKDYKTSYTKVTTLDGGKNLVDNVSNFNQNKLNVIVYNFVDALSHARTDVSVVRELADDEAAYRSLTLSWFKHSPLWEAMQKIAEKPGRVIISTDHGSIRVKEPVKIVGDRNTNTNLRYKQGKNLTYSPKEVFEIKKPELAYLPKLHVSSGYVFCREDDFFAYPNNYNYYVNYYKNTFQHGGISLEEMMIPLITLQSK